LLHTRIVRKRFVAVAWWVLLFEHTGLATAPEYPAVSSR
jgi:hypothetical protein